MLAERFPAQAGDTANVGARFTSFAPTLGVMLGLGAGIDYALLIVGRYREQLAAGDSVRQAARVATPPPGRRSWPRGSSSSSRSAACSPPASRSSGRMGVGSAIVVAAVAVGAVTVLPSLMGLRLGQPDDGNDRAGSVTRVAYDRLAEAFGPGFNGPLIVAVDTPTGERGARAASRVQQAVARTAGVAGTAPLVRACRCASCRHGTTRGNAARHLTARRGIPITSRRRPRAQPATCLHLDASRVDAMMR